MAAGLAYAAPLRAVDRVDLLAGPPVVRFRAVKTVTAEDPYMVGHFPDLTMLPAVFLLEGLRQAVGEVVPADRPPELLEVRSARLLAPMLGGDEITLDVELEPLEQTWRAVARCSRQDGTPVARLTVLLGDPTTPATGTPVPGSAPPEPVTGPAVLEHPAIRALLPVRHPMLLVDRVVAAVPGQRIEAVKSVTGGEPCYRGLPEGLPGERYAFPRSLALESFGQASALLWLGSSEGSPDGPGGAGTGGLLMLAAIRDVRFTGSAYPGDQLRHVIRLDQMVGPNAFLTGEIWASDRRLATVGTLIAVSRDVQRRV